MDAEQDRKLFVGGIPWQVNKTMLKDYFSKYGEVKEFVIVQDRNTHQPRGFGFVTFADRSLAEIVLKENHSISGKELIVKPSEPRRYKSQKNQRDEHAQRRGSYHPKKIFVRDLPHDLTEAEFMDYFEKFGAVDEGVIIYDKETNTLRGFGFITFESEEAISDVMQESFHELKNETVKVWRARLDVRSNPRCLVNWYESSQLEYGGLRYDDLAFGVDRFFCNNCGGRYGYEHFPGCLYGDDHYNGTWRSMHTYWVGDPWMWNGYVQSNWSPRQIIIS